MRRLWQVLIILLGVCGVSSLHFQQTSRHHTTAESELQALRAQQASFENQVNALIGSISTLDAQVKGSATVGEKVTLLENAIISERETVFALSNSIIPPFNLSKNACQELTNEQKIALLEQVSNARQKVESIRQLAASLPPCDEIRLINSDLSKQTVLIDSIEKAIYAKCESSIVLSPTIFQSNIYASNWILGSQTIDDLIEEYYQRSVQYDNITNCPLEFPFFDGTHCIACDQEDSVFNMFTKRCDFCPSDTKINVGLRVCQQVPHYSDYSKTNNYNLDGAAALPPPDSKLTPCPEKTPFWNGQCINCKGGKWWSVKDSVCKSCPVGQAFDSNLRACITPSGTNFLTVLQGTKWVTAAGNETNVLNERAKLISSKTGLQYCSANSPYFDGIQCISCEKQFDLTSLKCVSAPSGSAYDDNTHAFVPQEQNKETNIKAANILATGALVNSSVPDCDISTPFFDGVACIKCPEPFVLFNLATKTCVACDSTEVFNEISHKCERRPAVLISTNFNNLLATPKKSIEDYKKELLSKVQNNKDYIIDKCNDDKLYSNFSLCFSCKGSELFNVETKSCVTCNGTINQATRYCIPKNTFITSLANANNLLLPDGKTLKDFADEQAKIQGPVQACTQSQPYAVAGVSCIACNKETPYFALKEQKCVSCPQNSFYSATSRICEKGVFVSNVAALTKTIQVDNYTIANIKAQIAEIKKTKNIIECPATTPFFDGSKCASCPNNTYVNLKNFSCIPPTPVANVDALKELDNVFEEGNNTVDNLAAQIASIKLPTVSCDAAKPAYNGKDCYSCPNDKYYKLKTNQCVEGVTVTNVEVLKKLQNVKPTDNYTLANIEKQISASSRPTFACDTSKPFFDGKKCISCDSYSLYDLKGAVCIPPEMYTNTTALKGLKYIELGNSTISSIDAANAKMPTPKKPCPATAPLWNKISCISCPNGTYYNLQTLACTTPVTISNVDAIKKANNFLEVDNYTLANIAQQNAKNILPTNACDVSVPMFDGKSCVACANSLYNLKLLTCVNCTIKQYYNKTTNKCTPKPDYFPNLTNNNWIVGDAAGYDRVVSLTQTRKSLNNSHPCPASTEFFNNNTFDCQSCPNGTYFNYDTFSCVACSANQTVDPNTHQCATKMTDGIFQTSLSNSNLIYNGISIGELQDNYANRKIKYPQIKDCPQNKPYFDGYDCVSCHPQVPYFNIDTGLCQNCGSATYDSNRHDCIAENEVVTTAPNIAKMYSSIF